MASALSPQNTTLCRICSCTTAIHASATSCHRFHSGIAPGSLKAAPGRNRTHEGSPRTERQSLPVRIRKSCHALLIPPVCCGRRRRRRKGRLDGRGRITITHELGERPAIADRRERVGEGEGDTVAGRMSGAVLVTPARPGHRVTWWAARPPPNARSTSHCSIEQAPAPHTAAPSPWTGATSSPSAPPSKNHWAPPSTSARPAAPGSAAPMRTPTACCASTSPRGPHWTASAPPGPNRCTINSTNDPANASA